ncbi:hypothetical protein [Achromobacter xylosoxidans]|uniref:hypothetical protein n=1 Tax=Alcaligenes xylosoxydans xylosoxydans TaxID=85698 RepID=UPI00131D226C|nr:hypothetical protein [Achromobacter xylosoxidans]
MTTCKLRPGRTRTENNPHYFRAAPWFLVARFQLLTDPPGDINTFANIPRMRHAPGFRLAGGRVLMFAIFRAATAALITCCFDNALCRR